MKTTRLLLFVIILLTVEHLTRSVTLGQPGPDPVPPLKSSQAATAAQQADGWSAIKTDEGLLFVWNVRELYFSLAINGKEVKPVDDPEHIFFMVDGKVLQIQVAAIEEFAPGAREKKLDDRAILAAHRDWEAKFVEGLLKSKLTVQTFNAKLSSGSNASMWQFDMPESMNDEARKQLYLTVVSKNFVLLLNSVATAAISDAEGRKFLMDTIATLKTSPTPIDVKKLSESIRKAAAP